MNFPSLIVCWLKGGTENVFDSPQYFPFFFFQMLEKTAEIATNHAAAMSTHLLIQYFIENSSKFWWFFMKFQNNFRAKTFSSDKRIATEDFSRSSFAGCSSGGEMKILSEQRKSQGMETFSGAFERTLREDVWDSLGSRGDNFCSYHSDETTWIFLLSEYFSPSDARTNVNQRAPSRRFLHFHESVNTENKPNEKLVLTDLIQMS